MLIDKLVESEHFQQLIKKKAHTWLPAYFSRYELTPEEKLLNDKRAIFEEALQSQELAKVDEVLDLFPEILNEPLNNGEVAINYAVKKNLNSVISALLARGADPKTKDRFGLNAIDIALQKQDKALFAQLISNTTNFENKEEFIDALDRTVVTGAAAKTCLANLHHEGKSTYLKLFQLKFESEKEKSIFSSFTETKEQKQILQEKKELLALILRGPFVKLKQVATLDKLKELEKEVGAENFFNAAVFGGPLILGQIVKMGFEFPKHEGESSKHPLRFAFCSNGPIEAFIPFFDKLGFDIQSTASSAKEPGRIPYLSPELEEVSYFELLVYKKIKNAKDMDPIAVTGWDIAFATFSLCSFLVNYNYQYLPQPLVPFLRLGLSCANYAQAISLLVFKLSYTREGKFNAAISQLMTHYMVSQFFPVRIYYAGMTLYSALKTCYDHRYRSFSDLSKKLIVQIPAATELVHYTYSSVVPRVQELYDKYFAPTKQSHYNFNQPPPPKSPSSNSKAQNSGSSVQVYDPSDQPMLENTPFMKKFGKESAKAMLYEPNARQETALTSDKPTALGTIFNGDEWLYADSKNIAPRKVETAAGALEFGREFHKDTPWYKEIKGTPLEKAYNEMHLQAAATASVKQYKDGFSMQGAFRIDLKGQSAFEHFVRTVIEGGAMYEIANANEQAIIASEGTYAQEAADILDCLITGKDRACKIAEARAGTVFEYVKEIANSFDKRGIEYKKS